MIIGGIGFSNPNNSQPQQQPESTTPENGDQSNVESSNDTGGSSTQNTANANTTSTTETSAPEQSVVVKKIEFSQAASLADAATPESVFIAKVAEMSVSETEESVARDAALASIESARTQKLIDSIALVEPRPLVDVKPQETTAENTVSSKVPEPVDRLV